MRARNRASRGFTMVEVMVTVAIVGILASLAAIGMDRYKPRANLSSTAAQLHALLRGARQNALATGRDTVVMFFPQFANPLGGTGRIVIYEDGAGTFFSGAATPNFGSYDPAKAPAGERADVLEMLDLPRGITVGVGGMAVPALSPPYDRITPGACTFCGTLAHGRGAVVFSSRGKAWFFSANGSPASVAGGSVALTGYPTISGYRLLVISSGGGGIRAYQRG